MAFTDNTTFYGADAQGFYSKALLTGDTKSMIKVFPNVKSKLKVARLDQKDLLQAEGCSYNDQGTTTLSQKTLEVCDLKVNYTICTSTFEADYLSLQLKAGSNNDEVMPASIEEYILDQTAKNISKDLERLLWMGDTGASVPDLCDGFTTLFDTDLNIETVSGTTLSATNIIAEIGKVYDKIPSAIVNDPKVTIFLSPAAMKFYKQALAALGTSFATYNAGDLNLSYIGVPLVVAPGLSTNLMVAASTDNLWFGTDLMSDFDEVSILLMRNVTGDRTARFICSFKFGVNYGVSEEIVYYR